MLGSSGVAASVEQTMEQSRSVDLSHTLYRAFYGHSSGNDDSFHDYAAFAFHDTSEWTNATGTAT
jgi:hypothetical protein